VGLGSVMAAAAVGHHTLTEWTPWYMLYIALGFMFFVGVVVGAASLMNARDRRRGVE
jgi:hypothetical protein